MKLDKNEEKDEKDEEKSLIGLREVDESTSSSYAFRTLPPLFWKSVYMAVFFSCGPLLVILNTRILSEFPYPILIASLGQGATFLFSLMLIALGKVRLEKDVDCAFFAKNLLPISIFSSASLIFGNVIYLYLSISFVQMLKNFTPIIMITMLHLADIEKITPKIATSVILISIGGIISSLGRPRSDLTGVTLGILASCSESLKLVISQKSLSVYKLSKSETLFYTSCITCGLMIISSFYSEIPLSDLHRLKPIQPSVRLKLLLSSALSVVVNFVSLYIIQHISSIMLKVLGTLRTSALVIVGITFFGEEVTVAQIGGYLLSLASFFAYFYFKMVG